MYRDGRPVFLNLLAIHFPVGAVVSFGHRVSGVLLVLAIPLAIFLLQRSLASEQGYSEVAALVRHPGFAPVLLLLAWSLSHHLLAGIRFLLMDMELGADLAGARRMAWAAAAGAGALTLALVLAVWL